MCRSRTEAGSHASTRSHPLTELSVGTDPANATVGIDVVLPAFRYLGEDLAQMEFGGLRITKTRYGAVQAQPWHSHEGPNFHFLLQGDFMDESHELGKQFPSRFSLVFHPAGSVHRTVAGPNGRSGLNVEPTETWLAQYALSGRDLGQYRVQRDARLSLGLISIALSDMPTVEAGDAVLEALVLSATDERETPAWFGRLEARLEDDEEARWSLATLAADLGVHPVHLARVFRRRYGTPLTPYLHQLRLLRAARRLEEADCLGTVALEAGFSDHAHLSRSFKAWFGMTPSQARDRLRNVSILQADASDVAVRLNS